MTNAIEAVIYIHGVSNEPRGAPHTPQYEALHLGVRRHNPAWPEPYLGVEWGWNPVGGSASSHELLADAQRLLGGRALPAVLGQRDFSLNPSRFVVDSLRPLMLYGFGDIFYYVSETGKQAVRFAVADQIVGFLNNVRAEPADAGLSLTLIGHSAGAVIAFDFLFCLFYANPANQHVYLSPAAADLDEPARSRSIRVMDGLHRLRALAQNHQLRLRRLITLGAPITPLACRSDAVLRILAQDKRLDPADYGLTGQPSGFEPLPGPRWLNFWDRDDPIGWPVVPLLEVTSHSPCVEDVYVDVSDRVTRAHQRYWTDSAVHRRIAKSW